MQEQKSHLAGFISAKEAQMLFQTRPNVDTILSWMQKGLNDKRGEKGAKIKLRSVSEGSRWLTRAEWVKDFVEECKNNFKK